MVTITTGDNLTAGKEYVVTVKDLEPATTTYNVLPAAKVEVVSPVVSNANSTAKLETKVSDKDGNDISADYTVKFESANTNAVDADGNVTVANVPATGVIVKPYVVVGNDKVYGSQVTVKTAAREATTFAGFTLVDNANATGTVSQAKFSDIDPENVKTSIKIGEATSNASNEWYIAPYVLDQFGQKFSNDSSAYRYESLDPTVAVVNASTGELTPLTAGTVRVKITNGSFSKVVAITVNAASELKSFELTKEAVSLSDQSPAQAITVTAKDQYGDAFTATNVAIEENDPNGIISVNTTTLTSGSAFTITPVSGKEGTATITVKKGTVSKTVTVTVTKAGNTVAGYKAVVSPTSESADLEIDKNLDGTSGKANDDTVKIELYATDSNGNIINSTPVNAVWKVKDYSNGFATISSDSAPADGTQDSAQSSVTVTAAKAGLVTLVPVVGGLELAPVTVTVKDSTVSLKSVSIKRTTVSLAESVYSASPYSGNVFQAVLDNLEGVGSDGKSKTVTASDIKAVYSSDSAVLGNASGTPSLSTMTVAGNGRTTVTVVFKDDLGINPVAFTLNLTDDVAPSAPTIVTAGSQVTAFQDSILNASEVAADKALKVTLTGSNAVAGDTLTIKDGTTVIGTASVTATDVTNGFANVTLTASTLSGLTEGNHSFTAALTDAAGNVGPSSTGFALTVDKTAPTATVDAEIALDTETSSATNLQLDFNEDVKTVAVTSDTVTETVTAPTLSSPAQTAAITIANGGATSGQTITFTVTDVAGNVTTYVATYTNSWAIQAQ